MTKEEKYCIKRFDEWWSKEQGDRMKHSRYLAKKAWIAAWFKRMKLTDESKY